jgi:hypothetical protein
LESRGWFSRADSSHFAIISFRLASVDDAGHPPRIVESFLKSYFSADAGMASCLHYYDLTFSLEKAKPIKDFSRKAELMTEELIRFVSVPSIFAPLHSLFNRIGVSRLMFFITTHSDPDRGDLHAAKGMAVTPDDARSLILLPPLLVDVSFIAFRGAFATCFIRVFPSTRCCVRPTRLWCDIHTQAIF